MLLEDGGFLAGAIQAFGEQAFLFAEAVLPGIIGLGGHGVGGGFGLPERFLPFMQLLGGGLELAFEFLDARHHRFLTARAFAAHLQVGLPLFGEGILGGLERRLYRLEVRLQLPCEGPQTFALGLHRFKVLELIQGFPGLLLGLLGICLEGVNGLLQFRFVEEVASFGFLVQALPFLFTFGGNLRLFLECLFGGFHELMDGPGLSRCAMVQYGGQREMPLLDQVGHRQDVEGAVL